MKNLILTLAMLLSTTALAGPKEQSCVEAYAEIVQIHLLIGVNSGVLATIKGAMSAVSPAKSEGPIVAINRDLVRLEQQRTQQNTAFSEACVLPIGRFIDKSEPGIERSVTCLDYQQELATKQYQTGLQVGSDVGAQTLKGVKVVDRPEFASMMEVIKQALKQKASAWSAVCIDSTAKVSLPPLKLEN